MSSNWAATTTKAEGKASRKLGVLALALAVVSDATVAPVAQHELISRHDIPFQQPSCLQFKSVVLFIQAKRQWDLNRQCNPCQWRWVFIDKETAGEKYVYTMYICCSSKRREIFFGFHSINTNVFVFEIQFNYLVLRWPTLYTRMPGVTQKMAWLTTQKLCICVNEKLLSNPVVARHREKR